MRKPSAADLPLLRSARDAYRSLIDHCNHMRKEATDVGQLLAIAAVHDDLTKMFDGVGRRLSMAERTIPR